jgi:hypothetical protein
MPVAELIGLALVAYGIWFGIRGGILWFGTQKDWWRPLSHKNRYPSPASGVLLGLCVIVLGLRFVLHYAWENAQILGYVGGGLFIVVLAAGIAQPRFLHPGWYGSLEDRFGKKAMMRLKAAAYKLEMEEWTDLIASEDAFNEWVERTMPKQASQPSRGYQKSE